MALGQHTACDSFFLSLSFVKGYYKNGSIRRIQEKKGTQENYESCLLVLTDPLRAMQALGCQVSPFERVASSYSTAHSFLLVFLN